MSDTSTQATGNNGNTETTDTTVVTETTETTDTELGEKGIKALDAERRARAAAEKAATANNAKLEQALRELDEFKNKSKTQEEQERDKLVREAEERARKEVTSTVNTRLVRNEVRVAAAAKLADPEDAVRFLDLDDFEVDDKGDVDTKAIASAIEQLLSDKPYLAAKATKPKGDVDQGGRSSADDSKIQPGRDRLAQAYADSGNTSS